MGRLLTVVRKKREREEGTEPRYTPARSAPLLFPPPGLTSYTFITSNKAITDSLSHPSTS